RTSYSSLSNARHSHIPTSCIAVIHRHVHASLAPVLLRGLRPARGHQPASGLPAAGLEARRGGRPRTVPTFTAHRSARSASSYTPAASPRLRRRLSARPPHRLLEPAPELTRLLESGHVL